MREKEGNMRGKRERGAGKRVGREKDNEHESERVKTWEETRERSREEGWEKERQEERNRGMKRKQEAGSLWNIERDGEKREERDRLTTQLQITRDKEKLKNLLINLQE